MNQSEVLKLSNEELKDQLVEKKTKYNELKMVHAVSPLENPIQIKSLRRSIARIITEITNRETK
ncbi:MAG: 50S ribosomal protein L29 [Flavobacteriaceae bacterium]|jgi:large subunit ribosomal protein L29|nr:50S ribosomal protein L29 [Flavobacteriaceae bacterium]MBT4113494.1 50S ribosomal protein L29 [Flavobacteriaceae bacterium]MBT4613678.1 50S ribosomal protein L29 [Flavobacteriaceae bacterium]MBT5246012.1 50S ribosomal protein L29 [Flavobacteriaceae bacterium]MBT5650721.1 50S ribosomal protein L29 [Flavobacteriaceae bacterium]